MLRRLAEFTLCLLLMAPVAVRAEPRVRTLTLKGEVRVFGPVVMLSDIVEEKIEEDSDRFVTSSPPWGSKKFLTKNFIKTRIPGKTYVLRGPARIVIEKPVEDRCEEVLERLKGSIVGELSRRFSGVKLDSIMVEFIRVPERIELPPGDFEMEARLPSSIFGYSVVNFDLRSRGGYDKHLSVGCRFHIDALCAVSSSEIKRGQRITGDDFQWKKVDLAGCYEKPVIEGEPIIGMRARRAIPRNSIIPAGSLERFPDIMSGSEVSIEISRGSMRVRARGKSLEDGYIGKKVLVKNLVNNRIEKYEVVAPGIVSPSSRRKR